MRQWDRRECGQQRDWLIDSSKLFQRIALCREKRRWHCISKHQSPINTRPGSLMFKCVVYILRAVGLTKPLHRKNCLGSLDRVTCESLVSLMLCYVMLCYAMLCYAMLCYAMLCYVMLCYVMLCYVMLCYVMLCYATLRYVTLRYVTLCYVMLYAMACVELENLCHLSLNNFRRIRSNISYIFSDGFRVNR